MTANQPRPSRRPALALVGALALAAVTGPPALAAASPNLAISVDDGRTAARDGDRPTYTVTVRNAGQTAARGLRVTETIPAGARFLGATAGGTFAAGQVRWTLDVAAGATATVRARTQLTRAPAQLLRLATVACATAGSGARPLVCAADLDQLPAGAGQPPAGRAAGHPTRSWPRWLGGLGGAAAAVALGAFFVRRWLLGRRRPRHA